MLYKKAGENSKGPRRTVAPLSSLTSTRIDRLQYNQDTKIYYPINSIVPFTPDDHPNALVLYASCSIGPSERRAEELSGYTAVDMLDYILRLS